MITEPAIKLIVSSALLVGGYLIGSILPADLFFRLSRKKAPHEMGEKPGTYAVMRRVGLVPGILCLLFDFGKGFLPGFLAIIFGLDQAWLPFITVSPVIGHNWPFLRWNKGGWGMAATGGTFLAMGWWLPAILAAVIAVPCGLLWRSKPGLAIGGVGFPLFLVMLCVFHKPWINIISTLVVMAVEIYRRMTGERHKKAAMAGS
jgi:glycerol-3-phosphate acyltransferase PlsY